jgi:hypothetical protein
MQNVLIATRIYPLDDLRTGVEYEARDYVYRKPCGRFVLKLTSNMPGEPEDESTLDLRDVFAWLRELPEQIERTVYSR